MRVALASQRNDNRVSPTCTLTRGAPASTTPSSSKAKQPSAGCSSAPRGSQAASHLGPSECSPGTSNDDCDSAMPHSAGVSEYPDSAGPTCAFIKSVNE